MKNPIKELFDLDREEFRVGAFLFFFFFLVVAVFQILKPLKKGLFVAIYGADVELYAKLANIAVAALAASLFTLLYNRVSRVRLIAILATFFLVCFAWLAFAVGDAGAFTVWGFYLLGDLETTILVAAFWAYATDISSSGQAKRMFGPVGAGGVIGGWIGSTLAATLVKPVGSRGLLLLSAAMMGLIVAVVFAAERLVRRSPSFRQFPRLEVPREEESRGSWSEALEGMRLVLGSRYLLAIVGIMTLYEFASQIMDYQFTVMSESLREVEGTQAFIAQVYFFANLLSVTVQFFLVSFILKRFGLVTGLLVLPIAIGFSSFGFLASPTLLMGSFLVISDNGLNYSIQQTARESLYTIRTAAEKYKARAFTNMFVQRFAKGLAILSILAIGVLGTGPRYLSLITIPVVILMILCSIYAGKRFSKVEEDLEQRRAA